MIRTLGGLTLLALVGCGNQSTFSKTPSTLSVDPTLGDADTVVVGGSATLELTLSHITGEDIVISSIDIENTAGSWFSFDGAVPTVPHLGSTGLVVTYAPEEEGYHEADVTITYNNEEAPTLTAHLRGHALVGSARARPGLLDFGAVDTGDSKQASLELVNDGGVDLQLTGVSFTSTDFSLDLVLPAELSANGTLEVPISFLAPSTNAIDERVTFDLDGAVGVGDAILRANDCEHGDPSVYDADGDGYTVCGDDCDDIDPSVHPGATETADGDDEDCDGTVDEGTAAYDDDGDGYAEDDGDCNDGDPGVNPQQYEDLGNGVDDDCDGVVDQGTLDRDADGYSEDGGDCNDSLNTVYPGATELPDGVDNDCDGIIDEGSTAYDDDGDGYTEEDGDCDDTDRTIYPSATETADFDDDDCDGSVDEGTNYADDDGDGFTEAGGDCNDGSAAVNPAEAETARNGVDDNCDGTTS